jgi:hypothetical protein
MPWRLGIVNLAANCLLVVLREYALRFSTQILVEVAIAAFSWTEPLLFTVDAATVLLPIQPQVLGRRLTLLPPGSKILVMKYDAVPACRVSSDRADEFVFLTFAVEECGGEGVEATLLGKTGGGIQTHGIANEATVLFAEHHLSKEVFEWIVVTDDQRQVLVLGQLVERFQAPLKLLVRMDVGIEKETMDLPVLVAQPPKRDDGAWAAAGVQKYP